MPDGSDEKRLFGLARDNGGTAVSTTSPSASGVECKATLHLVCLMGVAFVAIVLKNRENFRGKEVIGLSAEAEEGKDDDSKWHIAGIGMV